VDNLEVFKFLSLCQVKLPHLFSFSHDGFSFIFQDLKLLDLFHLSILDV
jgi:hypothetical protein